MPKSVKLTEEAFRQCLFEHQPLNVPVGTLTLNSEKQMARYQTLKRGLSDACTKIVVHEDKVTCSPLRKNGKLIYNFDSFVLRMFLFREKKFLESLRRDVDLSLFIPKDEIEFLQEKKKLHQIQNKVDLSSK